MNGLNRVLIVTAIAACGAGLQGCVLAAAGAGAAGGYAAHEEGYRVQSPVTKDESGDPDGQAPVTREADANRTQ